MPIINSTDKKKALLAYKEKILNDIKYYENRINNDIRAASASISVNFEDSSDSEDECLFTADTGPTVYQLNKQQRMLQTGLHATQELAGLVVLQSQVDIMVEVPVLNGEAPVEQAGSWREVAADCRVDLVPFSISFYVHQANGTFGPKSYRTLKVLAMKPAQDAELSKSVLKRVATPSGAVEVLRNYAVAYRSRRATLARLADKFAQNLYMEPMPEGGYILKCANLLEISWVLENKWSSVAPFYHKMIFDLENMDESYIKIIRHAHKQLSDPSTDTDQRTLLLAKIVATCLEARGTQELYESMESETESVKHIEKRRLTLENDASEPKRIKNSNKNDKADDGNTEIDNVNKENRNSEDNIDNQIMAPPKSLPKKVKPKGKENTDQNRKSLKRGTVENDASNAKKAKINKNDANKVRKDEANENNALGKEKQDKVKDKVGKNQNNVDKSNKRTEEEQTKAKEVKDDNRVEANNKNKEKVAKSKDNINNKDKANKNQENVGKSKKGTNEKQTEALEVNNASLNEENTVNVQSTDKFAKNKKSKDKVSLTDNNEKKSSEDLKKVKAKSKCPEEKLGDKDKTDTEKAIGDNKLSEDANVQEKLKKKVTKNTESQEVSTNKMVASSKNDINKNSDKQLSSKNKIVASSKNDFKDKNRESDKVSNKDKNTVTSINDPKSKEPSNEKEASNSKNNQIISKSAKYGSDNTKISEIDDIPILSVNNFADVAPKKDINKKAKIQKVIAKSAKVANSNVITTKFINKVAAIAKPINVNKESNIKKTNSNKKLVSNTKSNENAVLKTEIQKNNENKNDNVQKVVKNSEINSKVIKKTDTQKFKPTIQKDTKYSSHDTKNTEKNMNHETGNKYFENNQNVGKKNQQSTTTEKKSKTNIDNIKKSTKIDKPKLLIKSHKNIASKKVSQILNLSGKFKNSKSGNVVKNTETGKENDSGSKISKIPMKLSVHESLTKKNPLRISPRKLPSTFKSSSDSNMKLKTYFTNIPRLLKRPDPKKISK